MEHSFYLKEWLTEKPVIQTWVDGEILSKTDEWQAKATKAKKTEWFLHSKRNHQQNERATYRMGEDNRKSFFQ